MYTCIDLCIQSQSLPLTPMTFGQAFAEIRPRPVDPALPRRDPTMPTRRSTPQVHNPECQSEITFRMVSNPVKSAGFLVASAALSATATAAIMTSTRRLPPAVRPAAAIVAHSSR